MPGVRQDLRRALQAIAFTQAGYFTAAQARDVGYSYQAQKHHADSGNWLRVDRGLFRLPDWPTGEDDTWVRWTLWSRGRGVVSYDSALRVHGLSDVEPALVHLTVPPGFRAVDDLVVLHRGDVPTEDRDERLGWSVTTPSAPSWTSQRETCRRRRSTPPSPTRSSADSPPAANCSAAAPTSPSGRPCASNGH